MKNLLWLIISIMIFLFSSWFNIDLMLSSGDWPYLTRGEIEQFSWFPEERFLWLGAYYQWTAKLGVQILGLSWELTERLFWFWPFLVLGFFGARYLFKTLFSESNLWPLASLIYLTNTYALMTVGGGQMGVALSYSLAPFVLGKFISFINLLTGSRVNGLKNGQEKDKNKSNSLIKNSLIKNSLIFALIFAVQVMFDPRIAYITGIALGIYFFISLFTSLRVNESSIISQLTGSRVNELKKRKNTKRKKIDQNTENSLIKNSLIKNSLIYIILVTCYLLLITIVVLALNSFWLIPMLQGGTEFVDSLGEFYTSVGAVKFLSFAFFENTISLLHPNWPKNEFGKVGFQRPEFLVLPILAYVSLLFINLLTSSRVNELDTINLLTGSRANGLDTINLLTGSRVNELKKKRKRENSLITNSLITNKIIFFTLLALLGAFLAKGANPPFGGVYLWMFERFPGFIMFRDPTKFYLLIALSYSVLIPFSLYSVINLLTGSRANGLKKKRKRENSLITNSLIKNKIIIIEIFILFYLFTIREAVLGQLGGTFKPNDNQQQNIEINFTDK